jgi:hypothetical protein
MPLFHFTLVGFEFSRRLGHFLGATLERWLEVLHGVGTLQHWADICIRVKEGARRSGRSECESVRVGAVQR